MAVKLWAVRLGRALTQQEEERLMQAMPAGRRERLLRMRDQKKWREPLCAYWILRTALQKQYPQLKELPEMEYGPLGKPRFAEYPEIHFSLSHTDGAVLVGLSDEPVGVDIEKLRPVRGALGDRLGADTPEAFFRKWTKREARAKRAETPVALREEPPMTPEERIFYPEVFSGFAACVCTAGELSETIERYTVDELLAVSEEAI